MNFDKFKIKREIYLKKWATKKNSFTISKPKIIKSFKIKNKRLQDCLAQI